nr:filamentous hemagglutinin N-terminal domain-containing protein [uncultured Ralstonia sp.]
MTQSSDKMIVDWNNMDVLKQETLNFNQKNSNASVLNRIHSADPTQILGALNANGNVFIVNPNGVLIGNGATINVGNLVASSLDIADDDFKAGKLNFKGEGKGRVVNEGQITAKGSVALLGGAEVTNDGTIKTLGLGDVVLASASDVTLAFSDSGLNVKLNKDSLNALVKNGGVIATADGSVKLTAWAIDALTRSVINNTGTIEATAMSLGVDGTISLESVGSGTVDIGGTLTAKRDNTSRPTPGYFGGAGLASIKAKGDAVHVHDDASLRATGSYLSNEIALNAKAHNGYVKLDKATLSADNVNITADNVLTGEGDHRPTFEAQYALRGMQVAVNAQSADQSFSVGDAKYDVDGLTAGRGVINEGFVRSASTSAKLYVGTQRGDIAINNGNFNYGDLALASDSGNILLNTKVTAGSLQARTGGGIEQAVGADINATRQVTLAAGENIALRGGVTASNVDLHGKNIRVSANIDANTLGLAADSVTQGSHSRITAERLEQRRGDLDLSQGTNQIGSMTLQGRSANIKTAGDTSLEHARLSGDLTLASSRDLTVHQAGVEGDASLKAQGDVSVGWLGANGNIDIQGQNVKNKSTGQSSGWGFGGSDSNVSSRGDVSITAKNDIDLGTVSGANATLAGGGKVTLQNLHVGRDASISAGEQGILLKTDVETGRDLTLKTVGDITKGTNGRFNVGGDLTYDVSDVSKVTYENGQAVKPQVRGKIIDPRKQDDGSKDNPDAGTQPNPEDLMKNAHQAFEAAMAEAQRAYEKAKTDAQQTLMDALRNAGDNQTAFYDAYRRFGETLQQAERARIDAFQQARQALQDALAQFWQSQQQQPQFRQAEQFSYRPFA